MEVNAQYGCQYLFEITDSSHAGQARRSAVQCAELVNFDAADRGAVALVVTEMATNLVKHAQGGSILCEAISSSTTQGLRVLSIDKGPGIKDLSAALRDGFSTYGSSGNGLGAIRRLSTVFDIYSVPERGTCIVSEFWPDRKIPATRSRFRVGTVSVPYRGEPVCGDGWASKPTVDGLLILVVDGLGHGTFASEAAREAENVLSETDSLSPAAILRDCHDALKKTRGAAAAVAAISAEKGTVSFAGLGNISGTLISNGSSRGMASHNGTLGHQMHRVQEFTMPWSHDSLLIMHSDGVATKWDLKQYPGLLSKHPSIIAAVLYRDFERQRDDATVLVAKNVD